VFQILLGQITLLYHGFNADKCNKLLCILESSYVTNLSKYYGSIYGPNAWNCPDNYDKESGEIKQKSRYIAPMKDGKPVERSAVTYIYGDLIFLS